MESEECVFVIWREFITLYSLRDVGFKDLDGGNLTKTVLKVQCKSLKNFSFFVFFFTP